MWGGEIPVSGNFKYSIDLAVVVNLFLAQPSGIILQGAQRSSLAFSACVFLFCRREGMVAALQF